MRGIQANLKVIIDEIPVDLVATNNAVYKLCSALTLAETNLNIN